MSEEIKSVRIRPVKEPSGYKSGAFEAGRLDFKLTIYRESKRVRKCAAFKIRGNGEISSMVWYPIEYKGPRYQDLTDDDLISDFIRTNTLRENPTFTDGLIEVVENEETKLVPFYKIIQDPYDVNPPISRVWGTDPYHLNNGSKVYIRWYSGKPDTVFWSYNNLTTASQSVIGEVSIEIKTNEPGKEPIVFTYSSSNNPVQPGVTPSYISIENYVEYNFASPGGSGFVGYLKPGQKFVDTNNLVSVSGVQYGRRSNDANLSQGFGHIDGFVDDARDSVTQSLSIKPEGLVKKVEVVPPEGFQIWGLSSETDDRIMEFSPIYINDLSSTSSSTQSQTTLSEKYFYDLSYEGNFNVGLDFMIIDNLLNAWNKKFPGYNVALNNPSFLYIDESEKIEYKDPINPPRIEETPTTTTTPTPTPTENSTKIKLNIVFSENFEVKVREDSPTFKIFVGDVPAEELPGEGFQFQDDFEDGEGSDPEFTESAFSGPEEQQIVLLNAVEDSPTGPNPEDDVPVNVGSTTPGPGPVVGSKLTNKDGTQMINLAGHRLKLVLVDLQNYLNANGYSGSKIESNGIMRDLRASAYPSSPARAAASLHGAGLAIDVKFNIPGKTWKSIGDNGNLSSDEKLTKTIMNWVKTQSDLTWGAQWGDGSNPGQGKVVGRGITEYHHFEIRSNEIPKYWEPVKDELSKLGFTPSELNKYGRGSRLHKLMLRLLGDQSA